MFIKFVDIDCLFFCVILTLVCYLRACRIWLSRNHMFIHEILGRFISFIFWNFEISISAENYKSSAGNFKTAGNFKITLLTTSGDFKI